MIVGLIGFALAQRFKVRRGKSRNAVQPEKRRNARVEI